MPACGNSAANCKFGYTVLDKTTGTVSQLPLTDKTFTGSSDTDDYWVLVDGYKGDGTSVQSTCCEVTVTTATPATN